MLYFVVGADGTGKSQYLKEKALATAKSGGRVLFVVPEQFSFLTEKYFYEKPETENIEITSFKKIEKKIFSSLGGSAKKTLTAAEKNILMWQAVSSVSDMLSVKASAYKSPDVLKSISEFSNTLKSFSASPNDLLKVKTEGAFREKLSDIAYILDAYEGIIGEKYIDDCGNLDIAIKLLYENKGELSFPNSVIFDEFWYFTGEQKNFIEYLLLTGADVYLPIECPCESDNMVFSFPKSTMEDLKEIAEKNNVRYGNEVVLEKNLKHTSSDMLSLWESYEKVGKKRLSNDKNIVFTVCPTVYSEAETVAARINEAVMEGKRYSEHAVVMASSEGYRDVLIDAFKKYNVPFFSDYKKPLSESMLVNLSDILLSLAIKPDGDMYISLLKSGFIDATETEITTLEKYAFVWNLSGKDFEKEFYLSPQGYSGRKNEEQETKVLQKLNKIREKLTKPIINLRRKYQSGGKNGAEITEYLYEALWEGYKLPERLTSIFSLNEDKENAIVEAERVSIIFSAFCDMLDSLYEIFSTDTVTLKEYKELFMLFAASTTAGSLPQNKDAVPIGEIGRVRTEEVKTLFVVGAVDGAFPKVSLGAELFSKREKKELKKNSFDFIKIAEDACLESLFTVYKTLMLPREKLYISYSQKGIAGDATQKSEVFTELITKFKNNDKEENGLIIEDFESLDKTLFIKTDKGAFSEMARTFNDNTPYSEALKKYFYENGRKEYIERLNSTSLTVDGKVHNTKLLNGIYPEEISLSASKTESFFKCHFSFFCQYTLGIKKWEKAELAPNIAGSLIHSVLEKAVPLIISGECDVNDIPNTVRLLMEECLENEMSGSENKDARFLRTFYSLEKLITKLLKHMASEFMQSEFVPTDFELSINDKSAVDIGEIPLPSGKKMVLYGFIDRVDILEKNGKKYVRVVDYKSGKKDFSLSDINYGLNMQMLLYLMALTSYGKGKYENALPAGVLYMPAREPELIDDRTASKEDVEAEIGKTYLMKGVLLNDEEILKAMEKDLSGKFIPAKIKKGEITTDNLASLQQFGYIAKRINEKLLEMAEALAKGDFSVAPLKTGSRLPCEYCEYKSVCGVNENTEIREQKPLKTSQVLKEMGDSYGETVD